MSEEEEIQIPTNGKNALIVAVVLFFILISITYGAFRHAKSRTGTIVLPGGITYLGPSPASDKGQPTSTPSEKIPVPTDVTWATQIGKKFPYSFLYPSSLSIGVFPGDPFDGVTVFWGNTNPQENIFLRVENLKESSESAKYTKLQKKEYVSAWWKQYNWSGIGDIKEFTNSHGMKGYRAKYLDGSGVSPFENVFFEVPAHPELVIWMRGKLFPDDVFDKMLDSVAWK